MKQINPPKGTRDFYPGEETLYIREHIFSRWHDVCHNYAFELYDAPMFEHLELYTQKSGEEIEKQLYSFQDKSRRNISLRPEMTPSLARMVAARANSLKYPLRWYSIPRLFRYERMQKGRLREFFQLNMDILGVAGVSADAELICATIDMMRALGFEGTDFAVHISSRTLLEQLFIGEGISPDAVPAIFALLDKKSKMEQNQYEEKLRELVPQHKCRSRIGEIFSAQSLDDIGVLNPDLEELENLRTLFSLIERYGLGNYIRFDIGIVRGLAYYTGIVFELFDTMKSFRAIAGGGRYDHLVQTYGGPPTPATGFAAGDVVLAHLMQHKKMPVPSPSRCTVYIAADKSLLPHEPLTITRRLRDEAVSCEYSLKPVGIAKQMKQAHATGARLCIIMKESLHAEGDAILKDMTSGEEHRLDYAKLLDLVVQRSRAAGT